MSFGQGSDGIAPAPGGCGKPSGGICRRSWGPVLTAGSPVFDHSHEGYKTGSAFENAMTISGGNDRTTFYLSAENNHHDRMFLGPNHLITPTPVRVKRTHRLTHPLPLRRTPPFAHYPP